MIQNRPTQRKFKGFTLTEMLVVIGIIVLLSGLTIGGFAFVNQKQARSQAEVQIGLLSLALQDYFSDNGEWPDGSTADGKGNTDRIFQALFPENEEEDVYLEDLDPENDPHGWLGGEKQYAQIRILDPWGNEYRYRTGGSAANPDFDLWSVGPDGDSNVAGEGEYNAKEPLNQDDVVGW